MIAERTLKLTVKGEDKATPALQSAGRGIASLGTQVERLSPHIEKTAEGVGMLSGILGLFSTALPPVATTIAAVGGAVSIAGEGIANMSDAFGYSMQEMGTAVEKNENVLATYFGQMPGHAKRLIGLGEGAYTFADGLELVAKTASHSGVFLAAWGDKIEKVSDFMYRLVDVQFNLLQKPGILQKVVDVLAIGTGQLVVVMDKLQAHADKIAPVLTKVGAAIKLVVAEMRAGGKEGGSFTSTLKRLRKAINPHLAESFERISDSLKELAKTAKEKARTALEKLGETFANLKDKVADAIDRMKDKFAEWGVRLRRWAENTTLALTVIGMAAAGLAPMLKPIFEKFEALMPAAGKLEGVKNAFLAIAREGAPALLASLKAASAGMAEQIDLMGAYIDATLLINQQVADRLPEALKYLTKISLATGESMDYLLDSLVRGVGRLSPKILDNLKIQVSLAEATQYAAEMFGKEADALSVAEKQTALMALTMDKLEGKTRSLAEVTGTLSQMMTEHATLQAENTKLLSSIFIPVAKSFYAIQIKLAKAFQANISEGGKYYNTLRKISATVSVLIDYVGELIDKFTGVGGEAVEAFADKMFSAAWRAFEWGANIINNLAIGMVRGATTALLSAMNFIGNILSYWLAPGSAPRIAQNLGAWGAGAFTEWLRGFTEADYSVLTGVQSPLRSALQNIVALGDMSASEAHDLYRSLSEAMAGALETGDPGGALAALAGVQDYGAELEKLFRHQMAVADATNAVEQAEARLVAARDTEEKMTKKLSKEAREYNRALKAGASKEVLRQKLAQMKATYSTLEAAREESELAEDDKKAAQERLKEQNSLMRLQNSLLQQLIEMGRVVQDISESEGPGWEETDWEIDMPDFDPLFGGVDEAFEALKASIRAKFEGLWADLKADWAESGVGQLMERLKEKWEESNLKIWLEDFIFDLRESGLKTALHNLWVDKIAPTVQAWLDDKSPAWANVWRAFTEEGIEDGSGRVSFGAALHTLWLEGSKKILEMLDGSWLGRVWRAFVEGGLEDGSGRVSFGAALTALWSEIKSGLTTLAGLVSYWVGDKLAGALTGREQGGESFWRELGRKVALGFVAGFLSGLTGLAGTLKNVFNAAIGVIERAVDNVITGVNHLIRAIRGIPGAPHIPDIQYIDFPRLAQGGMVMATEQLALMHKNEVALPLDDPRTIHALSQALGMAQGTQVPITIHNHFGRDSVRSDADVKAIADAMQRSLELQGVRTRIM